MEQEPALCLMCHDDLASAASGELDAPHYPVTDSCLGCHGPHSGEERLLVSPVPELCNACHDAADLGESHGGQITPATDCRGCHAPHGSANPSMLMGAHLHPPFADGACAGCHRAPFGKRNRLRARGEKLCEACHGDVGEAGRDGGTVHAAIEGHAGRAACLNCHDPHMSPRSSLLTAATPDLCAGCHEPLVRTATGEGGHAAAADDCLTCHRPHATEGERLLESAPPELCTLCHDTADEELAASHLAADLDALACQSCHDPHGSEHPSLLARTLHPPVTEGCDTCHEGSARDLAEDGDSALCLMCHDDIGEAAAAAAVPHPALEMARCADCHNPHASAQDHLIALPAGGECAQCHEDQTAGPGEVAHGVIELIGCRACHEPHGGSEPRLLRKSGSELCLSCHDRRRFAENDSPTVRVLGRFELPAEDVMEASLLLSADSDHGHPVLGHRTLGTPTKRELRATKVDFEGELRCLTCHDPHKGRSRLLLNWGAVAGVDACTQCHTK
jgi:predicted CXXCH cytochrome family protein